MIVMLILIFLVMFAIDWASIMKTNQRSKTLIVYLFLFGVSFAVSFLQVVDIELDSPAEVIALMVSRILGR